jgi:hypothetical protein
MASMNDKPPTDSTASQGLPEEASQLQPTVLWVAILVTYLLLFGVSGYLAFFQEPYNPANNPSQSALKLIEGDPVAKPIILEGLKKEGEAFQARKNLAGQSFNVVLGAILGFLSASAAHGARRRDGI